MKDKSVLERTIKQVAKNRKARHDFEVLSTIEAGIKLLGTEVKSIRNGKVNLQDAYAYFPNKDDDELFLFNAHISHYENGNIHNHEPKRTRKLLVRRREAVKLRNAIQEKGFTIIPLSVYFSGPFIKIELGICRAKKSYDKREALKERDTEREIRKKWKA